MNLSNIKVFLFDAFGTLFNLSYAEEQLIQEFPSVNIPEILSIWRTHQLEYSWRISLMETYIDFKTLTERALDYALSTTQNQDAILKNALMAIYQTPQTFEEVPQVLQSLQETGFQTAILSNGSSQMLEFSMEKAGIQNLIHQAISVEDLKIYKPSPKVYQMGLEKLGCQVSEVLFFSSNAWDVVGASNFGLQTFWVNRQNQVMDQLLENKDYNTLGNLSEINKFIL